MRFKGLIRIALFFASTTMVFAQPAFPPTRVVAFGDSLSDMGNTSAATFGFTPGSPYWQGRFSNGPVWVERLAARLSLPLSRSRSGGYNYAHGGAETGTGNTSLIIPNMLTQVNGYVQNRNPGPGELFVVWAGGNDLLNGQTNIEIPAGNIETAIRTLYADGARRFLVPNLPLLGYTPRYVGGPDELMMNQRSVSFNESLRKRIAGMQRSLAGVQLIELRVDQLILDVRTRPSYYGYLNVGQAAYNGSTVAPNPNSYLFFDEIHPTAAAHETLGDYAVRLVMGRR